MLNRMIPQATASVVKIGSGKAPNNLFERLLSRLLALYKRLRSVFRSSDNVLASKIYLRCRSIERTLTGRRLRFVSFHRMVTWTNDWIRCLPDRYDLIVGIPRSGLLVANIIASKLGKPLTTPEDLRQGRMWMTGRSVQPYVESDKILLVEDRVTKGRELYRTLDILQQHGDFKITTASLMVADEAKSLVDVYYTVVPDPVLFEWNLVHAKKGALATDLEGVLCHGPPKGLDSDEAAYVKWMRNAMPYLVPLYEIDAIVSSRPERYRFETESWLAKHRVSYKQLILRDIPSMHDGRGKIASYKAEALLSVKPDLYWEGHVKDAKEVYETTGIPTLCVDRMVLLS